MQSLRAPLAVLATGAAVLAVVAVAALLLLAGDGIRQSYLRGQDYRQAQNATKIARERVQQQTFARCLRPS